MTPSIQIYQNDSPLVSTDSPSSFIFSGGEIQVKVDGLYGVRALTILAHLQSSDDILTLVMTTDAIRRKYGSKVPLKLICPYLPYARQDRVMQPGEAHGLRVMCDLINSLEFDSVTVWDVHSDVALALLNNVTNIEQHRFVSLIPLEHDFVLVAPDAGAIKKTFATSKALGVGMVRADKTRSTVDGSITGTTVYSDHIYNKDFLIVDDICDGGRTFTELAKELRPLTNGRVLLYTTHGIYSKGFAPFEGLIDRLYVANPFRGVDLTNPLVFKLNVENECTK